jgi:protein tyrosine phosphatase (PTP) superfamily phosphohydrolase (DUF442 family)
MPMLRVALLCAAIFSASALAAGEAPKPAACAVPGYGALYVAGPGLFVGGMQSADELRKLKELGVTRIIDLRAEDDAGAEQSLLASLNVDYTRLPVAGADGLTLENARRLDALLAREAGATLVHCATGNRAAALLSLRAAWLRGEAPDQALSFMRRSGLNGLEPAVLARLGGPAAP